jgi:hypothetical protein
VTTMGLLWQTDFTYLKVIGWGCYSRYIIVFDHNARPPTEAALDTDDHERNWLGCSHILCRRLGWRCRWVVAH